MAETIKVTKVKDQLWRGRIIKFGIDQDGHAEMVFEIYDTNTNEVIHPSITVNGSPDDVIKRAQTIAAELRLKIEQAETIKEGDEFNI